MTALASKTPNQAPRLPGGLPRPAVIVIAVLSVVAVAAAVFFGVSWFRAAHDDSLALAKSRDAVLLDAQQAAINLNTLDYEHVEQGIDLWEQSTDGEVKSGLQANRARYIDVIKQAKRKTVAKAVDGAVAELDDRAGTARVLVGVDVTVTPEQGDPTVTRMRLQLAMKRTDAGWKVTNIGPVGTPSTDAPPK